MKFTFTIEIEAERESGKFAARDEIEAELVSLVEGSDPGEVDGVGADGESVYTIVDWTVSS